MVTGYWNMFKQNIGIMIAVAQLAATQRRFAAVQNEFRRFGMDIVAASVRRAQEQGYGAELNPEHTAAAIALLFENFTTVFVGASGPSSLGSENQRRGRHRHTVNDLEENPVRRIRSSTWISALPEHLPGLLAEMDTFIEPRSRRCRPRTCSTSTSVESMPAPIGTTTASRRAEWEDLLAEMRRRADKAGWLRYGLPASLGGRDGTNVDMAVIREHLAHKGLGLHNDLQNESSIVGNFPQVIMMERFGTDAATPGLVRGVDHRRALDGLRPYRAAARLRCDLAGDARQTGRRRAG